MYLVEFSFCFECQGVRGLGLVSSRPRSGWHPIPTHPTRTHHLLRLCPHIVLSLLCPSIRPIRLSGEDIVQCTGTYQPLLVMRKQPATSSGHLSWHPEDVASQVTMVPCLTRTNINNVLHHISWSGALFSRLLPTLRRASNQSNIHPQGRPTCFSSSFKPQTAKPLLNTTLAQTRCKAKSHALHVDKG